MICQYNRLVVFFKKNIFVIIIGSTNRMNKSILLFTGSGFPRGSYTTIIKHTGIINIQFEIVFGHSLKGSNVGVEVVQRIIAAASIEGRFRITRVLLQSYSSWETFSIEELLGAELAKSGRWIGLDSTILETDGLIVSAFGHRL